MWTFVGLRGSFLPTNQMLVVLLGHGEAWATRHKMFDLVDPGELASDLFFGTRLVRSAPSIAAATMWWGSRRCDGGVPV